MYVIVIQQHSGYTLLLINQSVSLSQIYIILLFANSLDLAVIKYILNFIEEIHFVSENFTHQLSQLGCFHTLW